MEKLKYDILRNSLRTMIAEKKFGPKTTVEIKSLLESVRGDDEEQLEVLSEAAKSKRATVRKITGSNGEPIREEAAA